MRKVELRMNEEYKYKIIKKLVETNGNKQRAAIKLKRYLEQFKPREYRSIQNFIITKKVVMLYNEAISKLTNHENNDANLGVMHVKSIAGEEYKIHYSSHSTFKLGEMYLTSQYVIYIVKSSYEKYYENYIEKTKKYSKPDRRVWNIVEYILPNVEKHFETSDGNFAIFVKKPCEMYSLKEILEYFGGKLKPEYVSSILTRLYYFTCYMGLVDMTHNAIILDNIFFTPGRRIEEGEDYTVNDMRIVGIF